MWWEPEEKQVAVAFTTFAQCWEPLVESAFGLSEKCAGGKSATFHCGKYKQPRQEEGKWLEIELQRGI